jgi:two-component system, OmpR family, KDP operon response regulator KdpE
MTVLVVSLAPRMPRVITHTLADAKYDFEQARGLDEASILLSKRSPEAVILYLEDSDIAQTIRELATKTAAPIIAIAAGLQDEEVKVEALDAGACYCLIPPVGAAELPAWIRAAHRRISGSGSKAVFAVDDLLLDASIHRISRADGSEVTLTPAQWRLVELLARHNGDIVSYAELHTELWGARTQRTASLLRSHLSSIRQRVERDPRHPRYFVTVRGVGIVLAPNPLRTS